MSIVARPRGAESVALPLEVGFLLAQGFPPAPLLRAVAIGRESGTDAATALLATGLIAEEAFYRALARALHLPFLSGALRLGEGVRFPDGIVAGCAPLAGRGPGAFVSAPRGAEIAELLAGGGRMPAAITTPSALRDAVFAARASEIARHAAEALEVQRPEWAYRPGVRPSHVALAALVAILIGLLAHVPTAPGLLTLGLIQLGVLASLVFRLAAVAVDASVDALPDDEAPLSDRDLPVYTVLVALHREARVVPRLIHALGTLDYPAAKLDLKFVIEADDDATRAALEAAPLPARFEIVTAPPGQPRTKPRALNAALPLARGELLVVYDAEDVPDRDQLRKAAALFARAPRSTACLQGRLVIDNDDENWLTRCFALEYAALFDVLGPALAAWRLPIPHFRTEVLRSLHGWDAWNVTEDADLGMRLALAGYRVGDLPSATYEEAPARRGAWLRQRIRWMKGFMQTSVTHGRRPVETMRRLGPLGALCAAAMIPGTVISALAYPIVLCTTVWSFAQIEFRPSFWANLPAGAALVVFGAGLAAMVLPATLGALRRGWRDRLTTVPWLPFYFLLVSLAAWLALVELVREPFRWNKTEHGLARRSRTGALRSRLRAGASIPRPSRPAGA